MFDHLPYEERVEAIKKYVQSQKRYEPLEVEYYEECKKNREHNNRTFFGAYGGIAVFIILAVVSHFFPSFLANDEHFAVVGRYAASFVIAYALYPLFADIVNKR